MQQHVLPLETSNLPYQGCLTRRRSTKWLQGKNQVRLAIISLKREVNWEILSHLLWRTGNLADRSKSNGSNFGRFLSLSLPFNPKGEIRISPIKQQFISLRRSTESFRTVIDCKHFESISSLFFTTGPPVGKIGHMRKSVAFEAYKVQTISVHKMSEIYNIRPPNEVTSSKWKKHEYRR